MDIILSRNIIKLIYQFLGFDGLKMRIIRNSLLCEIKAVLTQNYLDKFESIKFIKELTGFKLSIYAINMLHNGDLVVGSDYGLISMFDSINYTCYKELKEHKYLVYPIIVLQNGNILSRSFDAIILWDPVDFKPRVLKGHTGDGRAIIQLKNGNILSSATDQTIILWGEERPLKTIKVDNVILEFKLFNNNHVVCIGNLKVHIMECNEVRIVATISEENINTALLVNDRLLLCHKEYFLKLGDNFEVLEKIQKPKTPNEIILVGCNKLVTVMGNLIMRWDTLDGFKLSPFFDYSCVGFSRIFSIGRDDIFVTLSHNRKNIKIWYCNDEPKLLKTLSGFKSEVNYLRVSGEYLTFAMNDDNCQIWKFG
jgi:WD40 repeat protein